MDGKPLARKRVLTERRRAQNRLHQKKFRERRKVPPNEHPEAEAAFPHIPPRTVSVGEVTQCALPSTDYNVGLSPTNIWHALLDVDIPSTLDIASSLPLGRASGFDQLPSVCLDDQLWDQNLCSISRPIQRQIGCPLFEAASRAAGHFNDFYPYDVEIDSNKSTWKDTNLEPALRGQAIEVGFIHQEPVSSFASHDQTIRAYAASSLETADSGPEVHSRTTGRSHNSPRLPDPFRNHIRINRMNLYAACLANSDHLGVPRIHAKSRGFRSPFAQRGPSIGPQSQPLGPRLSSFQHIKHDLQPVPAQITQVHEYYIDLFPFPTFRARLLSILSLNPSVIDEDDLKADLDADGLICWGSAADSSSRGGSGAPWDMRSWEAQPFFLAKWWFLTDGEVAEQSRWWRSMRGEDI